MTPTHAISADEARRLLHQDRANRSIKWCLGYSGPAFQITPGWVDRDVFRSLPDSVFDLSRNYDSGPVLR